MQGKRRESFEQPDFLDISLDTLRWNEKIIIIITLAIRGTLIANPDCNKIIKSRHDPRDLAAFTGGFCQIYVLIKC